MESHAPPKSAACHIIILTLAQLAEKQHLSILFCNLSDKVIWYINYPILFIYMEIMTRAKTDQKYLRKKRQKNLAL